MSEVGFLAAGEIEFYVQSLKPSQIEFLGSKHWFDEHQRLEKLRQQCILEATNNIEERVKDLIVSWEKIPILVHEAIIIQLWQQKVWKKILKVVGSKIENGFICYMILYHECTAMNFLQIILHHRDAVQSLKEEALDLVDYCINRVIFILSEKFQNHDSGDDDELTRLCNQKQEMGLNTGLAAIAILASLSEFLDDLSISTVMRLYDTHDVPVLLANLIEAQPWKRQNPENAYLVYTEGRWIPWDGEELSKPEAQCWIALRGLLLHNAAKQYYEMTQYRRASLVKLQKFMHEVLLDQMLPLIELKQYISQLSVYNQARPNKSPLILETVAPIRENLVSKGSKWRKLFEYQIDLLLNPNHKEQVLEIAKSVSETYDADMMESLQIKPQEENQCQNCGKLAVKRCSQCQNAWYCTRKCQVQHWTNHKTVCIPMQPK